MQTFKAIPTTYADIDFRSRLEARYAAFFDLLKWKWEYEPINLRGWIPDFRVDIAYYGDYGRQFLLVEVKPYRSIDEFKGSVEYELAMNPPYPDNEPPYADGESEFWFENTVALFGHSPAVSHWDLWTAGWTSIPECIPDWSEKWKQAQSVVQWRGGGLSCLAKTR
jgi:hypothetical protein